MKGRFVPAPKPSRRPTLLETTVTALGLAAVLGSGEAWAAAFGWLIVAALVWDDFRRCPHELEELADKLDVRELYNAVRRDRAERVAP